MRYSPLVLGYLGRDQYVQASDKQQSESAKGVTRVAGLELSPTCAAAQGYGWPVTRKRSTQRKALARACLELRCVPDPGLVMDQ